MSWKSLIGLHACSLVGNALWYAYHRNQMQHAAAVTTELIHHAQFIPEIICGTTLPFDGASTLNMSCAQHPFDYTTLIQRMNSGVIVFRAAGNPIIAFPEEFRRPGGLTEKQLAKNPPHKSAQEFIDHQNIIHVGCSNPDGLTLSLLGGAYPPKNFSGRFICADPHSEMKSTSLSTPKIHGIFLREKHRNPHFSNTQILDLIFSTADYIAYKAATKMLCQYYVQCVNYFMMRINSDVLLQAHGTLRTEFKLLLKTDYQSPWNSSITCLHYALIEEIMQQKSEHFFAMPSNSFYHLCWSQEVPIAVSQQLFGAISDGLIGAVYVVNEERLKAALQLLNNPQPA